MSVKGAAYMRYRNSKYSTNRKGGFAPQKGRASTQRRQPIQNQNRQTIRSTNRPAVNQRQPFQGRSGYYGSPARKRGLGRAIFFLCAIFALGCVGFKLLFHHDGPTKADNPSIQAGAPVAQDGNTIIPDITIHQGDLVLVNREAPYQEDPNQNLVSLYDYKQDSYNVKDKNLTIEKRIVDPLNQMLQDFHRAKGPSDLLITSAYRDLIKQNQLYKDEIAALGSAGAMWVSRPGYSEHHTGLALDLTIFYVDTGLSDDYDGTGIYSWINQNCQKYGFVVRYPEDKANITNVNHEPWHFRYVGLPHAEIMVEKGYCFEEYIDSLRSFSPENPLVYSASDGKTYQVYFIKEDVAKNGIPIPNGKGYAVSGNNVDGYIVTITE